MNRQFLSNLIALGEGSTTEFIRAMPADLSREIALRQKPIELNPGLPTGVTLPP